MPHRPFRARSADGIHDLLLRLGDLSRNEIAVRLTDESLLQNLDKLIRARRLLELRVAGEKRVIAIEDAARYRDALGIPLPPGIPTALLAPITQPVVELVRRYARTHGPFTLEEIATRFALDPGIAEQALNLLVTENRIIEGGFRPISMGKGQYREWVDREILQTIRRKSLARLRKEVEPVEQQTLARFLVQWQGLLAPRRGMDALLDVIENLQGAPIAATLLESAILPARIVNYQPSDLDTLVAAGELSWTGVEPLGERDGRMALYLPDKMSLLAIARSNPEPLSEKEEKIIATLRQTGASFFTQLHDSLGGGYPGETLDALWTLVWRGLVTNDSLHPLRAYTAKPEATRGDRKRHLHAQTSAAFRSRRTVPATAQGRWSLVASRNLQQQPGSKVQQTRVTQVLPLSPGGSDTPSSDSPPSGSIPPTSGLTVGLGFSPGNSTTPEVPTSTEATHALTLQLLTRYGILLREAAAAENIPGGFSAIYPVLKALEESGRIRRGYFVAGLGATQFALPAAVDLLRSLRNTPQPSAWQNPANSEFVLIAATDPANPYGSTSSKWPDLPTEAEDSEKSAPRAS